MKYQDIYNCICQNTKNLRYTIHYVKPTAQLLFESRFPKVDQHAGDKWLIHDTKRHKDNNDNYVSWWYYCPACRTSLIATIFWVVMICPIIKCLTVLRVFFYFVWFVFIHHNFQFHFELCTYCNILDIYLSQNLNFVNYLLFYMKLLNYLFFNMFGSVLECCELTGVSLL